MNRKSLLYLLVVVASGILFSYCSRPKEVLDRKEMEKLMYDVYIAEAMIDNDYSTFDTPQKKEALIHEVFKKHRTTQAQWDTSLSWYSDRIDIYLKMNDSVKSRIQRRQQSMERVLNRQLEEEQLLSKRSYLGSFIPRAYCFDEVNPIHGFRFKLDSAEIADKINDDDFSFAFNVFGIPEGESPKLRSALILEYKDTTIYRVDSVFDNRKYALRGQKYISNDTLKKIAGFVRMYDSAGLFKNIWLTDIALGGKADLEQNAVADSLDNRVPIPDEIKMKSDSSSLR